MRANEFISELFQPGKKFEWGFRGSEEATAYFTIGNVDYQWYANVPDAKVNPTAWDIVFKVNANTDNKEKLFGRTGTGNEKEVMSTVVDITRQFLEQYSNRVLELRFSAKEDSRASLYIKMIQRLLPDWKLHTKKSPTGQGFMFSLTSPQAQDDVDEASVSAPGGPGKYVWEDEVLDEMPLPLDWNPAQFKQQGTTFKSRLDYALERARKLGTGSSRVATVIEYQGRPTVLKIAKNNKGLAQNEVEASVLSDGYASQLGILIPIIDYDEENPKPLWIHTEMAIKASDSVLCSIMKVATLHELIYMAYSIAGKNKYATYQDIVTDMKERGVSDDDIETATQYANVLAELASNFDIKLGDFTRKANWGLYQGKPVVVDVGFNEAIYQKHYKRR